ncbi:hypothetical protein L596_004028 [Steinernema carpocapsae]|uniref:Uncharacterized protein n=1 Tax=Steinernema carpocapsae TaxID=34508 RepID=A0A4U8UUJ9_STECR|nr:hypothetical protein L596_004028 [Steinernema carpocapsae]
MTTHQRLVSDLPQPMRSTLSSNSLKNVQPYLRQICCVLDGYSTFKKELAAESSSSSRIFLPFGRKGTNQQL